jgi:predicted molibdopterin-dependent oxidoreductase YjgC
LRGDDPAEAYLKVFKTKSEQTAKKRAALLVKQKRIQTLMREELQASFAKQGIDLDYLIGSAKEVVDGGKNDSDRLKALNMLWDAFGVVEKQAVTEVKGIFQGFSPEQLDSAENGRLLNGGGNEE